MKKWYLFLMTMWFARVYPGAAPQTYTHMGAPGGTYLGSCKNIEVAIEGNSDYGMERLVKADCRRANGAWQKTSVRISLVNSLKDDITLSNNNGTLESDY